MPLPARCSPWARLSGAFPVPRVPGEVDPGSAQLQLGIGVSPTRFPPDCCPGSDAHPPPMQGGVCYGRGCLCHLPCLELPARHQRIPDGAKPLRLIPFSLGWWHRAGRRAAACTHTWTLMLTLAGLGLGAQRCLARPSWHKLQVACSLPNINIWKVVSSIGARQVCATLCSWVSCSWGGFCSPAVLLSKGAVAEA